MADKNLFFIEFFKYIENKWILIGERKREYVVNIFISFITLFCFLGVFQNGLLMNWDDHEYIINNGLTKDLSFNSIRIIFSTYFLDNYHPLTTLSNAVEYLIFGLNPHIYHFNNLLLHLLNGWILFYLSRRLGFSVLISGFISLLFAVHPMHVESVVWASERKDVLYTFFYLSSLIFYINSIKNIEIKNNYIASLILFILSLLSKSAAVSLPVLMLVFDVYYGRKISLKLITEKIPFFILSLTFGIIALDSQKEAMLVVPNFSSIDRLFLTAYAFQFYIVKFLLPINLSTFHPYPVKVDGNLPFVFYFSFLTLLALLGALFVWGRKNKLILFGSAFYAVSIFLVLQIVPIGRTIVSERFSYVPYIGLTIILIGIFNKISIKYRLGISIFAFLYIASLMFVTLQRIPVWKNGYVLFSDVIIKYPNSAYAYSTRAYINFVSRNYEPALADCQKALELDSLDDDLHIKIGMIKLNTGFQAEAEAEFKKALRKNPENWFAYDNLGLIYHRQGRLKLALVYLNMSIILNSEFLDAYASRGSLKFDMGDYQGALNDFLFMLKYEPYNSSVYQKIANTNEKLKKYDDAIIAISKSIEYDPYFAEYYFQRGMYFFITGKYNEAVKDFTLNIVIDKKAANAYYYRALSNKELNNISLACKDINIASSLGHAPARNILQKFCQ